MGFYSKKWEMLMIFVSLFYWKDGGCIEVVCHGIVQIEPKPIFLMGSNITVLCHSYKANCNERLVIYLNETEQKPLEKLNCSTVKLQLTNFRAPHSTVVCKKNTLETVCGQNIEPGYPPDKPTNLNCVARRNSKNMTCSWQKGRKTHINTVYTVTFQHKNRSKTFSITKDHIQVPLSSVEKDIEYMVSVKAYNLLGEALSDVLLLTVNNIVIPDPPTITKIDFVNSSQAAVVHWNTSVTSELFSINVRYRTARHGREWVEEQENEPKKDKIVLKGFQPFKCYEFQIRSCRSKMNSSCSVWSLLYWERSPEAAPSRKLDVWRILGRTWANGTQTVTILWKALSPEDSRGVIRGYQVSYQEHGKEPVILTCDANETQYQVIIPATVNSLLVTTFTSAGSSPAAELILGQKVSGAPKITNLISAGNYLCLTWDSNCCHSESLLWYIVEWHREDQNIQWRKVETKHNSTCMEANEPGIKFRISLYGVAAKGETQPAYSEIYAKEEKPQAGPQISLLKTEGESIHIKWDEIPLHQQRGFITQYTIYLRKNTGSNYCKKIVIQGNVSRERWLEKLDSGFIYIFYMTASTLAGEGPPGEELIYQPLGSMLDITMVFGIIVAATILVGILANLMFWNCVRKRIKRIWALRGPRWLIEKFPKVENSNVIKLLQEKERNYSDSSWLSTYSDPPITRVEEIIPSSIEKSLFPQDAEGPERETVKPVCLQNYKFNVTPIEGHGYKPQISKEAQKNELAEGLESTFLLPLHTWINPIQAEEASSPGVCGILTSFLVNMTHERSSTNLTTKEERDGSLDSGFTGTHQDEFYAGQGYHMDDSNQSPTLLPDELVNCLKATEYEPAVATSYFPQFVLRQVEWSDC
nr:PREDICTED: interleukin-23 receptor isoform X2 [Lepisosteus oculatus]XP_015210939.1 PREDICTED: interleukin-23 receptor isoform X2 [Lepisosteus oculatus]